MIQLLLADSDPCFNHEPLALLSHSLMMFVSAFSSFRFGKSIYGIHGALLPGPRGSFYEFEVLTLVLGEREVRE